MQLYLSVKSKGINTINIFNLTGNFVHNCNKYNICIIINILFNRVINMEKENKTLPAIIREFCVWLRRRYNI